MRKTARDLLNNFEEGTEIDLVENYCLALAADSVITLLGIEEPPTTKRTFAWSNDLLALDKTPDEVNATQADIAKYFQKAIESNISRDNLLHALSEEMKEGRLTTKDATALCIEIFIAAHFTTSSMMALQITSLLLNKSLRQKLINREIDTKDLVEELMRRHAVFEVMPFRIAVEDIEVGGKTIPAGSCVVLSLAAANMDETSYPQPKDIDINRGQAKHLQFGTGKRQCLGSALARAEIRIGLEEIFDKYPGIQLMVESTDLEVDETKSVHSLTRLPVILDA